MEKRFGKNHAAALAAAALFWIGAWHIVDIAVGADFLLAGPRETLSSLTAIVSRKDFWATIANTLSHIMAPTVVASITGVVLGSLSSSIPLVDRALSIPLHVMKSSPVACIIVILLILFGSSDTTALIVAIVACPPFYYAAREARADQPIEMNELLDVFGTRKLVRFLAITWPASLPFFRAASKTALAMSWKAGVAAEILGIPDDTIGEAVYLAKLSLDMAGVLSWLLVIIVMSLLCEKAALTLLNATSSSPKLAVLLSELTQGGDRSHHERSLWHTPEAICLWGPTGCGKTTALRSFMGLSTHTESGPLPPELDEIYAEARGDRFSVVFQETRLVPQLDAIGNVLLASCGELKRRSCEELLADVLPTEALRRPVEELSGGMRRLVELVRSVSFTADVLVLDEPFTGLDEQTKKAAAQLILRRFEGRYIVMTSHVAGDPELLGARVVSVQDALQNTRSLDVSCIVPIRGFSYHITS